MTRSSRKFLTLCILATAALAAGCTTLVPPDVTLVNLRLTDITLLETTGEVAIRVSNLEPEPIAVDGAALSLYLDGAKVGRVLVDEGAEVQRLDSAVLEGRLHISHVAMVTRLNSILEQERFDYRLAGKLYLLTESGSRRSVRIERSGDVDLTEDLGLDLDRREDVDEWVNESNPE